MMIPKQLQDFDFRFTQSEKNSKACYKTGWKTTNNHLWNSDSIKKWDGNVGIICGKGNLVVLDCDKSETQEAIVKGLPETYVVKTCSGGTHWYYKCNDLNSIKFLTDGAGEIRANGQVLIAGSQAMSKTTEQLTPYKTLVDKPIAKVTGEQIKNTLSHLIKKSEPKKETQAKIDGTNLPRQKIPDYVTEMIKKGAVKGIRNKTTFQIVKDLFNYGLTEKEIIEHLVEFNNNCKPPQPRYEIEQHVKYLLRDPNAYLKKDAEFYEKIFDKVDVTEPIKIYSMQDIKDMKIPPQRYLIDRLIPKGAMILISGKSGAYKSFVGGEIAYCMLTGKELFDTYKTEKIEKILYLEEENTLTTIKKRHQQIFGKDILNGLFIANYSGVIINKQKDYLRFKQMLETVKPEVVIVDTISRIHNLEENDAGQINQLLQHTIRPLMKEYGFAFIFLHHDNKSKDVGDEGDRIRGSSEFVNIPDTVLKIKKFKSVEGALTIAHIKGRDERLEPEFRVIIDFNDEKSDKEKGKYAKITFTHDGAVSSNYDAKTMEYQKYIIKFAEDNDLDEPIKRQVLLQGIAKIVGKDVKSIESTMKRTMDNMKNMGIIQNTSRGFWKINYSKKTAQRLIE